MAVQTVFKRYELKFLLTAEQKEIMLHAMAPYMKLDQYGRTTIRNLYYDTDNYLLIRRSIEKPIYKEKLRIRSYNLASAQSTVFVELKKKFGGVVYKRRLAMPNADAARWLSEGVFHGAPTQIAREIDCFAKRYEALKPKVFLSYEREAYYPINGTDFRVTFDDTILCRQEDLSLESEVSGTQILPEDMTLMEIKCSGGIPMWMTKVLSEQKIYKTSYSKYGEAYKTLIFSKTHPVNTYHQMEVVTHV